MGRRANQHTPDNRTPQELAEAILGHEVEPPSYNFGKFLGDNRTHQMFGRSRTWMLTAKTLLAALNALSENESLTAPQKEGIKKVLLFTHEEKKIAIECKDIAEIESNPNIITKTELQANLNHYDDLLWKAHFKGSERPPRTEEQRREAQERMGDFAVKANNWKQIEKLLRTLASKLGIELTEPGLGR